MHALDLRWPSNPLTEAQVLARVLAKGPALALQELLLRANLLEDAHTRALAGTLRQGFCPPSQAMNLSYNRIGMGGAKAILDVAQAVGDDCSEDAGVQALAGALKRRSLGGLKVFDLGADCNVNGGPKPLASAFKVGASPASQTLGSGNSSIEPEDNGVIALAKILARKSLAVLQVVELGSNLIGNGILPLTVHCFPPMAHRAHRVSVSSAHCATASIQSFSGMGLAQAPIGVREDDRRDTTRRQVTVSLLLSAYLSSKPYLDFY